MTFGNYKKGCRQCKECYTEKRALGRRTSIDKVINNYLAIGYTLLNPEDYKNNSTELLIKCRNGHIYKSTYKCLTLGCICPECAGVRKYTIEECQRIFEERSFTLLDKEYVDAHYKMAYICNKHNDRIQYMSLTCARKGIKCWHCYIESVSGENSQNWKSELTEEDRILSRQYPEYKAWVYDVFNRDCYTCQICGIHSGTPFNAHHLDGYNWCVDKRLDVNNGITLCEECHKEFHVLFGYGNNTINQFIEYCKFKSVKIPNHVKIQI